MITDQFKALWEQGAPHTEAVKELYRKSGYSYERDFPGEYYFMYNPVTLECVRLYYDGHVLEYKK